MKKVFDYLRELGLSERQAEIYMGFLESGPSSIQELARFKNIQRSTVHKEVDELMQKGLVYQTKKGSRRRIVAEDPRRLTQLIDEKIARSQQLKSELDNVVSIIEMIRAEVQKNNGFDFRYYEGEKAILRLYQETLTGDENYSFVNLDKLYEVYDPRTRQIFLDSYDRNRKRRVWDIAINSPKTRKVVQNTHDRYFSKFISSSDLNLGFDIQIYDNKIGIIQLEKGKVAALVIDSEMIYSIMKVLHQIIWAKIEDDE